MSQNGGARSVDGSCPASSRLAGGTVSVGTMQVTEHGPAVLAALHNLAEWGIIGHLVVNEDLVRAPG